MLELGQWANVATIAIGVGALGTLAYTARQVQQNTSVARAQFWLELEKMFAKHDEVNLNLRPGGRWEHDDAGPDTVEEWAKVEDYMGLFEHCELLLEQNLIDADTFEAIFAYRIQNIIENDVIVDAKLIKEALRAFVWVEQFQ